MFSSRIAYICIFLAFAVFGFVAGWSNIGLHEDEQMCASGVPPTRFLDSKNPNSFGLQVLAMDDECVTMLVSSWHSDAEFSEDDLIDTLLLSGRGDLALKNSSDPERLRDDLAHSLETGSLFFFRNSAASDHLFDCGDRCLKAFLVCGVVADDAFRQAFVNALNECGEKFELMFSLRVSGLVDRLCSVNLLFEVLERSPSLLFKSCHEILSSHPITSTFNSGDAALIIEAYNRYSGEQFTEIFLENYKSLVRTLNIEEMWWYGRI